jgi:hypothetical protein
MNGLLEAQLRRDNRILPNCCPQFKAAASIPECSTVAMPLFVIENFAKVELNTLPGFAKVRTPSGIVFHDVASIARPMPHGRLPRRSLCSTAQAST